MGQTESWNGTNWTELNDLNTNRYQLAGSNDSNTATLAFGGEGSPPSVGGALTEEWNGVSWVEVADLSTARASLSGAGSSTLALAFAGNTPAPASVATEEWNNPSNVIKTLTD